MRDKIKIKAVNREDIFDSELIDVFFYQQLPEVKIEVLDPNSGKPVIPLPGTKQTLVVIFTSILSSTVLSTTIQAWLTTHPTTIEVTVEENGNKKTIKFEGPNIKDSKQDIKDLLDEITPKNGSVMNIRAIRKADK